MSDSPHNPSNRQRPSGRPDKSVYRKRRIIALIAVVAVIGLIWALVSAAIGFIQNTFGGNSPAGEVVLVTEAACAGSDIQITPVVADTSGSSAQVFDSGMNPFFGYTVTNTSSKDCSIDLGPRDTFLKVTSGDETIWTTGDCDRTGLTSLPVTLKAGESKSSDLSVWNRVRSSSTGCGAEQEPVTAGGASYHLNAEVAGFSSKSTQQFILN